MPIFEFSCLDCSKESEILVRSAEWKGEAQFLSCGSRQLEKMLSVFTATGSNESDSVADSAPCSGMPNNCGRCGLDN